jgi:hypothetical protein
MALTLKDIVIANKVKQSMTPDRMDCRVAALLAMTAFLHIAEFF